MKIKKFLSAIILSSIVISMFNTFMLHAFASTSDSLTENDVKIYHFRYDVFRKFIENPSKEVLEQKKDSVSVSTLIKGETDGTYILKETIGGVDYVTEGNNGECKIGNVPIYSSLIDFVGNKLELESFLVSNGVCNGVSDEIEDICIIDIKYMPVAIWLRVNQENYFITVDEVYSDYTEREDKSKYVYRLYSYTEYYDKFGIKNGKLLINGKDFTAGNYVKVHYSGAYIPFRTVVEGLGAKVDWNAEKNVALLSYGGKEYVLDPNNLSMVEVGTEGNILMPPPGGGGHYYCEIIDDKIIMNSNAMLVIIGQIGAKINVDYDNLIVKINMT